MSFPHFARMRRLNSVQSLAMRSQSMFPSVVIGTRGKSATDSAAPFGRNTNFLAA